MVLEAAVVVVVGAVGDWLNVVGRKCGKMKCERCALTADKSKLVGLSLDVVAVSVAAAPGEVLVTRVVSVQSLG
jgi:hypothetical protein